MFASRATVIAFTAALLISANASLRFVEVGRSWGFDTPVVFGGTTSNTYILESTGTGAAIFDFDRDGRNDVLIASGTRFGDSGQKTSGLHLYRRENGGTFRDVSAERGLVATGWAQGVCAADIDNDGYTDVLITYYGANRLFRNNKGMFEDITRTASLPVAGTRWGSGCAWVDYDRDGFVDLFIANYVDFDVSRTPRPGERPECIWKGIPVSCGPTGLPKGRNALYRNRGDGTFEDVSAKAGILAPGGRYGLGVVAADFNNDGWPDIYVACDQTPGLLFENRRNGTFKERGVEAGVAYNADGRVQSGMGVAVADFDGNGFLDIVKTNFSGDLPSLYLNEDGRYFNEKARESGLDAHTLLGWGIAVVDIDEDGAPDLMMANGHVYPEIDRSKIGETYRQLTLLYHNSGAGQFVDVTGRAGDPFQTPRPARGLATGDLDGDGRPEFVIVNINDRPSVLRNETPRGNWIRIALEGTKSNRSAIGARITVTAGSRKQIGEVMAGGSYYSQNELPLYFGLGKASTVQRIDIRWPSGVVESYENIAANRTISFREGDRGRTP